MTSVRVVGRECLSARGVGPLPHVLLLLDSFLDTISGPDAVESGCCCGDSERRLSYLAARDTESFWWDAAVLAATNKHVHVLRWLSRFRPSRCDWTVEVMDLAAIGGHLSALQWLYANRNEGCSPRAIWNAAKLGHLAVMQWLHEHYWAVSNGNAIRNAAWSGHLPVVQWLYRVAGEVGDIYRDQADLAAQVAMERGHLHVAEWLNSQQETRRGLQ